MKVKQIRQKFLDYFQKHDHRLVPSASLIPSDDPSLLFTNSGMVPFKDYFLGQKKPPSLALTSSQRCLRVGGKHNDLENVGHTSRHLTLFEMLGNFSFGAYDKKKAIVLAWQFVTKELLIPEEKLLVTVYESDDEAYDIWHKTIGLMPEKIIRCGEKDNFWQMADTGPCGPSSEIFYDHGPSVQGGKPGEIDADGDRYCEIWNLVFMQYHKNKAGELTPLPIPCVDTGMGLSRVAALLNGDVNVFQTDDFQVIFKRIEKLAKSQGITPSFPAKSVIADHFRAVSMLIYDQVRPSNEGRGYVLRRLLRRAFRYAKSQGFVLPSLSVILPSVLEGFPEPDIKDHLPVITEIIDSEEASFIQTMSQGLAFLHDHYQQGFKHIDGLTLFKLYDTHGFPLDLAQDFAKEKGMTVDLEGFEKAMAEQKARSKAHQSFVSGFDDRFDIEEASMFLGYEHTDHEGRVIALFDNDQQKVERFLDVGQRGVVVLNQTPFYAESGGQVGDSGELRWADGGRFIVEDTQKVSEAILHYGYVASGPLALHQKLMAYVDSKRSDIAKNHSATHLLHAMLEKVLGQGVVQKGSLVNHEKLRFDFTYPKAIDEKKWYEIEKNVNALIWQNLVVTTQSLSMMDAKKAGAKALFTEKYGDVVRVVSMGDISIELCGGNHVERTGDIGLFVMVGESAISQGVRRIEAYTGARAYAYLSDYRVKMMRMAADAKIPVDGLLERFNNDRQKINALEKEREKNALIALKSRAEQDFIDHLKNKNSNTDHDQKPLIWVRWLHDLPTQHMRDYLQAMPLDRYKGPCVVMVLSSVQSENYAFGLMGHGFDGRTDIKKVFDAIKSEIHARGGGKGAYIQGSGQSFAATDQMVERIVSLIGEKL